jgi:hypothetical protein
MNFTKHVVYIFENSKSNYVCSIIDSFQSNAEFNEFDSANDFL